MTASPSRCVIDTNVAVTANAASTDAPPGCIAASGRALANVMQGGHLYLDAGGAIVKEYRANLGPRGEPGPGDEFLKWVLTNRSNTDRCLQVEIQCDQTGEPLGFPHTQELHSFDRSDRKFAVTALEYIARNSPQKAPVLNATDSDWWHHRIPLAEAGIELEFLCQDEILKWLF